MKRILTAVTVLLCLVISLIPSTGKAAGSIYFTAIENTVNPLNDNTMPTYINGLLYIPYTFFSSDALGIYFAGETKIMLYSSSGDKTLTFDTLRGTVTDQRDNQYYIPAQKINGRIYVSVDLVCAFFEIEYQNISCEPAPVLRFSKGPFLINDKTFIGMDLTSQRMREYYNAYTGVSASPGVTSPSPSSAAATYEGVTLYLSFYNLEPQDFSTILDGLDTYGYNACFFVSYDEIAEDADLIRRAAGTGHTIGIWLKEGTFEEYQEASQLLFEAAKLRTVIVSAYGGALDEAKSTADAAGLVFWSATRTYDQTSKSSAAGITGTLSVLNGSRESLSFACTDKKTSMMRSVFAYISDKEYNVRRLTERTTPTYTIG